MRPVPVVFLRLAFSPQLTVLCYSQFTVSFEVEHTLADLGSGVSARGAGVLLDVEGATTCKRFLSAYVPWPMPRPSKHRLCATYGGCRRGIDVPQRLQSVCVLLWRFPKLEVPFAISQSVSRSRSEELSWVRRTHFELGAAAAIVSIRITSSRVESDIPRDAVG
jgi:hypothetical protein